ncbi:MAG: hypothetical protein WB760_03570 [Xanthobacteraceae bacterium]
MDEEGFFLILFWLIAWPFWLGWKVIVIVWQFIVKPLNQSLAERSARKMEASDAVAKADKQKAREEVRAKQLEALRATAPQSPPERMRATIHINEFKIARMERQQVHRAIAEHSWINVEVGEDTRYAVDVLLEMSERERGIIQQNSLEDIVIEDTPAYTKCEIRDMELAEHQRADATKDLLLKEITKGIGKDAVELMKAERSQTRVGDYLVSPFTRVFPTPHEAKQYSDQLKTKLLPSIKDLIESYREHAAQQTVEF